MSVRRNLGFGQRYALSTSLLARAPRRRIRGVSRAGTNWDATAEIGDSEGGDAVATLGRSKQRAECRVVRDIVGPTAAPKPSSGKAV